MKWEAANLDRSARALRAILLACGAIAVAAGCGNSQKLSSNTRKAPQKDQRNTGSGDDDDSGSGSASGSASASGSGSDDVLTQNTAVTIETQLVDGAEMQVKNVDFLRKSIAECVGTELNNKAIFALTIDAKVGSAAPDPKFGKIQFYNGNCPAGGDILGCLSTDLYDPNLIAGDTVASNALQVNYLQALGTVANVVAHNCDVSTPGSSCMCDDDQIAAGLVKRCLPYLEEKDAANASAFLAQTCRTDSTDPGQQNKARRAGMANLIGSVAFAKSRE